MTKTRKNKYIPEYKKYEGVLDKLAQANNIIVGCHDELVRIGVSENTMNVLGFALRCLKDGINKIELDKLEKEREWNNYFSQFKIITFDDAGNPKEETNV